MDPTRGNITDFVIFLEILRAIDITLNRFYAFNLGIYKSFASGSVDQHSNLVKTAKNLARLHKYQK